jgi:hypothetical protein
MKTNRPQIRSVAIDGITAEVEITNCYQQYQH